MLGTSTKRYCSNACTVRMFRAHYRRARGEVLTAAREAAGLSRADLAAAAGVRESVIRTLEHGERGNVPDQTRQALAAALGVSWHTIHERARTLAAELRKAAQRRVAVWTLYGVWAPERLAG